MSTVKANISPELKKEAEIFLKRLGISSSQAIRMFYAQIVLRKGLPFEVNIPHIPNEETIKAIEEARQGIGLNKVENIDQLKKELDVDC